MTAPEPIKWKPRLVGVNCVALEVGDLDAALAYYGAIFVLALRGRAPRMAFLNRGDPFLAVSETEAAAARGPNRRPE